MRTRPLYDVVTLLARTGVGVVFIAHGWQKIQVGVTATAHGFDDLGVPVPTAAAVYATFVELLGGTALILGLGLPVAGLLLFVDMLGAFVFVNAGHGLFVVDQGGVQQGFELVLVLGLTSLLFAAGGGGRLSLDSRIFPRRRVPASDGPADSDGAAGPGGVVGPSGTATPEPTPPPSVSPAATPGGARSAARPSPRPKSAPVETPAPAESPRLAADILNDTKDETGNDTLVAGRKRPRKPNGGKP